MKKISSKLRDTTQKKFFTIFNLIICAKIDFSTKGFFTHESRPQVKQFDEKKLEIKNRVVLSFSVLNGSVLCAKTFSMDI
jgi:hypothetical protein